MNSPTRVGSEIRPTTTEDVDAAYQAASVALYESTEDRERPKNRSAFEKPPHGA